jgi:cytidyltransferase-like protein
MKTVGIIAEFNPFHNGHRYLIERAKKITGADNAVIVCSGNFVQRGVCSIIDKSKRATSALLNGADIILELPVVYSCSSAELFSTSAIRMLDKLNCIDYLCFGCETENIKSLPTIAHILHDEPEQFKLSLSIYLKEGLSFPLAREKALIDYCQKNKLLDDFSISQIINSPNNILAIEYLKALKKFNSNIQPVAIKRAGAFYDSLSLDEEFASATGIRKALAENMDIKRFIPSNTEHIYDNNYLHINDFSSVLGAALVKQEDFFCYHDIGQELSNRINNLKSNFINVNDFTSEVYTKNSTFSSVSRALLHIMLNITKTDVNEFIAEDYLKYTRLLGFKKNTKLLSVLKANSQIDIISKFSNYYNSSSGSIRKMLNINLYADELYRMIYMNKYNTVIPTEFERQISII